MQDCDRHASESQPGGGVCASCLRERLTWLWRGESPQIALPDEPVGATGEGGVVDSSSSDAASGRSPAVGSHQKDIVAEWAEFQARRRRSLDSPRAQSRSLDSSEVDALMAGTHVRRGSVDRSPQLGILMSAQKLRTRSMPLDNRAAEDTASRVIREEADELFTDELDFLEGLQDRDDGGAGGVPSQESAQRCFSPAWHSGKTPKWVRVLMSPVTSRNRVFPSRSKEDARKGRGSRKRLTRFASSDWSHTDANGVPSLHWLDALRMKEGFRRTTIRSSVLSWLQDSERTKMKKHEESRELTSSSAIDTDAIDTDTLLRDLITVGHLHEIAEEIEEEADEALTPDSLDDIDSFGKFLLSAAQRQPKAGLTSLSRAASG